MIQPPLTHVQVRDLCVFGFHGVLPEEQRLGQRFLVSVTVAVDLVQAMEADDYSQAVCYGQLCALAHEIVAGTPCRLIETVACRIAEAVLARHQRVQEVQVELRKPSAPVPYTVREAVVKVIQHRHYKLGFSFGANLGEREAVLRAAVDALARHEGIMLSAVSSLYESAPWGVENQPAFLNLCAIGETTLRPHAVLAACKEIESALGRLPGQRWGERAVDIDLLFYGQNRCDDPVLTVPHRHLFERAFVLVPLGEIAPNLEISGRSVTEALARLPREPGDIMLYTVTTCA